MFPMCNCGRELAGECYYCNSIEETTNKIIKMNEEKKIPTAESMIDPDSYSDQSFIGKGLSRHTAINLMIAYAKLHRENMIEALHQYSCERCADAMDEIYPESNIK